MKKQTYAERSKNPRWVQQTKEAKKRWYQKNKEKIKEKVRKWENENPERKKISQQKAMKKYVASGKMGDYMKNYYKENKDLVRVRGLTNYYRKPLLIYFDGRCRECGSQNDLEFHHTSYKLSKKDKFEQLKKITILLCKNCHKKVHNS